MSKLARTFVMTLAVSLMAFSSLSYANPVEEKPSAFAMTADALFARPMLLATTIVGGAVYVVSLPFSLLGGNAKEAGQTLFLGPAEATFVRCLGCTQSGRKQETVSSTE
ncbi:hypothetical protein EZI54_12395 [Marinobacter halodurans]|uniref:Multidrug transporter n=1 Tax=Marinobacter halodurans TaxID=2528979 RepID=A0ABY1ZL62_9GAMM|nr:hypothetical protein [Marinobacter halodurans]TBW54843.1 hypothetical protein EZI54_12395 [Marinobacter halodurans]